MASAHYLLLVLLIFGSLLVTFGKDDEDESEEATDDSEEADRDPSLTKEVCMDANKLGPSSPLVARCCDMYFDNDTITLDCFSTHVTNANPGLGVFGKVADCVFIKKKFTKGTENFNFYRIQAAANKLEDPRERKYMMSMYKACSNQAKEMLKEIKARTKPGQSPMGVRRPFYALAYMCMCQYSAISCPYFRWQNMDSDFCSKSRDKCRKLLRKDKN